MKNSDQRLCIVVFFFSCLSVHATSAMTTLKDQKQAAQEQAPAPVNPKFIPLPIEIPTHKKSPNKPIPQHVRSTASPVGMTYSASWPDFRSEYRSETPPVDRRNSESKSARPADHKEPRTFEDFVYEAKDAAAFVKILRRNSMRLQYFLEKLTPDMLDSLLHFYSSDFLYCCIRDKIILDAIDRAIRRDKFMKSSEPYILKINIPDDPIEADNNFNELVADMTVLMLLAERGLTALIQVSLLKQYVTHCNTVNDQHLTALDYAQKAYAQTKPLLDARGLLPEQRVRYRHEVTRLEECMRFLRENGALTGAELTQKTLQNLHISQQAA